MQVLGNLQGFFQGSYRGERMFKLKNILSDRIPFVNGYFYHVYNKGNNKDDIFFNEENYKYFLRKYDEYLSKYLETYAFCLIPNHFHLLIKVKTENGGKISKDNKDFLINKLNEQESINNGIDKKVTQQFSNFFNCYTKSVNVQQERKGSLFQKHFKRRIILEEKYLSNIIFYIHLNPVYHKLTDDYKNYRWSSYWIILREAETKLKKKDVLEYFGGKKYFIQFHKETLINNLEAKKYLLE